MSFNIKNLAGDRALIEGTDILGYTGRIVVCSHEWNELKRLRKHETAHAAFDAAVEDFYADLAAAAAQLEASHKANELDPLFYEVIEEGAEAVEGKKEQRLVLSKDSVILKLIESGNTDRLIWVGDDLEILEADALVEEAVEQSSDALVEEAVEQSSDVPF